jgi:RecA-family ATPase
MGVLMNFEEVPDFLVQKHSAKLDRIEEQIVGDGDFDNNKRIEHFVKLNLASRNIPTDFVNTILSDHEKFEKKALEYSLAEQKYKKEVDLYSDFVSYYIDNIDTVYDNGASLLFYGTNETGKTFTALWILSYALQQGYSGYYISFQDLYKLYNNSSYEDDVDTGKLYSYVKDADFVVVDELGKESSVTEGIIGFLESFVKYRSTEMLPTIFCTNIAVASPKNANVNDFYKRYGNSPLNAMIKRYKAFHFKKEGKFRQKTQIDWESIDGS